MEAILKAKNISMSFGGLKVVTDFNLEIKKGELVGLIGPNGAGKTTVFNILTGVYLPTEGIYTFDGQVIIKGETYKLIQKGLARTFQNIRLFDHLTVLQNVMVANNFNMKYGVFDSIFRTKRYWEEENQVRKKALNLLRIFDLDKYAYIRAGGLPYGEQRKLEIARALATEPKLLLLDEPAAGMNPRETEDLMKTIKLIREEFDISILLIEHDMNLVLGICQRLIVLDHGNIIAQGEPLEVVNSKEVIRAYLGDDSMEGDFNE